MAKYKDLTTGLITEGGPPELNPEYAKGKEIVSDTTPLGSIQPISTATLSAPAEIPLAFKNPNPDASVYPNYASLYQQPTLAPQPKESEIDQLIKQTQELRKQGVEETAFRAEQEKTQQLPEITKSQQDLTTQLRQLQLESQAIPLQVQSQYAGRASLSGQQGGS